MNVTMENEILTGSWEAGVDGARPGLIMPGTPAHGARYFQEIADRMAVDRGEIVAWGLTVEVPDVEEFHGYVYDTIIDTQSIQRVVCLWR